MAQDPDWNQGSKYIYLYFGSFYTNSMQIARFSHEENAGGLESRGDWGSQKMLWKDIDSWGNDPHWHYGGAMQFGPDGYLYLTLGTVGYIFACAECTVCRHVRSEGGRVLHTTRIAVVGGSHEFPGRIQSMRC